MTRERYEKVMLFFGEREKLSRALGLFDRGITDVIVIVYVIEIILSVYRSTSDLLAVVIVPGISFILVSVFRTGFNAQRPYEKYGIPSALKKNTQGVSFPSRHVFSVFVIGMSAYYYVPALGLAVFLLGIIQAVIRVLGGVHFIRDVLAGALSGLLLGYVGFYIIFSQNFAQIQ